MIASVGVCTRPSETAPSKEERRRIVAARVAFMPTIQSASERERAACSSRASSAAGRSVANAVAHRRGRHRREPQPAHRQRRAGLLVEVGEDQLALAPGVAGVDDLGDVVAVQLRRHDRHLLLRALVADDELEAVGDDRQVGHPPALELGVVLVGLGELHEVADGPADHVLGALEVALVLGERAGQHAREVAARRTASRRSRVSSSAPAIASGRRSGRAVTAQPVQPSVETGPRARARSRAHRRVGDAVAARAGPGSWWRRRPS